MASPIKTGVFSVGVGHTRQMFVPLYSVTIFTLDLPLALFNRLPPLGCQSRYSNRGLGPNMKSHRKLWAMTPLSFEVTSIRHGWRIPSVIVPRRRQNKNGFKSSDDGVTVQQRDPEIAERELSCIYVVRFCDLRLTVSPYSSVNTFRLSVKVWLLDAPIGTMSRTS